GRSRTWEPAARSKTNLRAVEAGSKPNLGARRAVEAEPARGRSRTWEPAARSKPNQPAARSKTNLGARRAVEDEPEPAARSKTNLGAARSKTNLGAARSVEDEPRTSSVEDELGRPPCPGSSPRALLIGENF